MSLPTPTDLKPEVGDPVSAIETPALVLDLDAMERNLDAFVDLADRHGVTLCSHTKMHKTPYLAHRQSRAAGGAPIYCQTVGEAEVMAAAGLREIHVATPIVGDRKLARLASLSRALDRSTSVVDGPGNLRPLGAAAGRHDVAFTVYLELDIGQGRCGVEPGEPAVRMAERIDRWDGVELEGLLAHDPHLARQAEDEAELEALCAEAMDDVGDTADAIEAAGIPVSEVTTGCTATARYMAPQPAVTGIDPGRYLFNDATTMDRVGPDRLALSLLSTVISAPTADRAIVDAGYKAIGGADQRPVPRNRDDLEFYRASAEHGYVDASRADGIEVGDRLAFVPDNAHAAVGGADSIVGVRDGRVENVWAVQGNHKTK